VPCLRRSQQENRSSHTTFDGADEVCRENETGFLVRAGDIENAAQNYYFSPGIQRFGTVWGAVAASSSAGISPVDKMVEDQYVVYRKLAAERGLHA